MQVLNMKHTLFALLLLLAVVLQPVPVLAQAASPTITPLYTIKNKVYGFPGRDDGVYALTAITYNSDGSDTIAYKFVNSSPSQAASPSVFIPQTGSVRVTWHGITSVQPFSLPPLSVVTDDSVIAAISLRYDKTIEVDPKSLAQGETLSVRDVSGIETLTFNPGRIQPGTTSRAYAFRVTFPAGAVAATPQNPPVQTAK